MSFASPSEAPAVIDDFVWAGYEANVNFSPVIVHEQRKAEWRALSSQLVAALPLSKRR